MDDLLRQLAGGDRRAVGPRRARSLEKTLSVRNGETRSRLRRFLDPDGVNAEHYDV